MYSIDMTRNPDEIMAEYLLNGGKMLSESCKKCGAPLFEVKGRKMCVVCSETEQNTQKEIPKTRHPESKSSQSDNIRVIIPNYAKEENTAPGAQNEIADALDNLIREFCRRAQTETDTARCLTLTECIRTAAEAKIMLNRK